MSVQVPPGLPQVFEGTLTNVSLATGEVTIHGDTGSSPEWMTFQSNMSVQQLGYWRYGIGRWASVTYQPTGSGGYKLLGLGQIQP